MIISLMTELYWWFN